MQLAEANMAIDIFHVITAYIHTILFHLRSSHSPTIVEIPLHYYTALDTAFLLARD